MESPYLETILSFVTLAGIALAFLIARVMRSHKQNIKSDSSRMIGLKGKALTEITTKGRVIIQGEYWWATSDSEIVEGESILVVGIDGLTLIVEPYLDHNIIPKPISAVPIQKHSNR